jgi:hypothetical protein
MEIVNYHALQTCGVRGIDVKGRKVEGLKKPINKGFPDNEYFSRLFSRGAHIRKPCLWEHINCPKFNSVELTD